MTQKISNPRPILLVKMAKTRAYPEFTVGTVVCWNQDGGMLQAIRLGGYDEGPFVITSVSTNFVPSVMVARMDGKPLTRHGVPIKELQILCCELVVDQFLTAVHRATLEGSNG